jgi:hypothetical protein
LRTQMVTVTMGVRMAYVAWHVRAASL